MKVFASEQSLQVFDGGVPLVDADKLDAVEALCQEARDEDLLGEIPPSRRDFVRSTEMVITVKRRLHHLGYFKSHDRGGLVSTRFRASVRRFQSDAGIREDGWVGKVTWQVLEELFSFEAESRIDHWATDEARSRLLKRAVQLRLFAYGFMKTPPRQADADVTAALQEFVRVAALLRLCDAPLEGNLSVPTLNVLFDQDGITRRLARFPTKKPWESFSRQDRKRLKRFLVCHARVELWLMGYNVEPNGSGAFVAPTLIGMKPAERARRMKQSKGFFWSLSSFSQDFNATRDTGDPRLNAGQFLKRFPLFFKAFGRMQITDTDVGLKTDTVYSQLQSAVQDNPEVVNAEWKRARSLGGRLRDGVRRAWGWIKRMLKRVISRLVGTVVAAVRSLVRVAWSYARHGFGIVWSAIRAFPPAVRFFLRQDLEGSAAGGVAIRHDGDFDWKLCFAPRPDLAQVRGALNLLDLRTRQFSFATRILKLLAFALTNVAKFAVAGYFGLVMAILRILPQLEGFMDFYLENRDFLLKGRKALPA